jgi:Fe2+ or Zn2+ uptake regulation protein
LRKLGIRMTFGTVWNTLDHMRKTQRVHRILLGKKYYWCTTLPKDGLL